MDEKVLFVFRVSVEGKVLGAALGVCCHVLMWQISVQEKKKKAKFK